jgi:6-phosphogluconolactonase (cycloisomerase 2 family)
MMPSNRLSLVLIVIGLAALVGCGSSSTHTAYVTLPDSNAVAAYRIDNHSARFTPIVGSPYPAGTSPSAVLVHPSGELVYVANEGDNTIELFSIDHTIGSLLEVPPRISTGLAPSSLVMDTAGSFLFSLNQISGSISAYSINSGNGALSPVTGSPFPTFPNPVTFALTPSGKFMYVVNANLSAIFAYTVTSGVVQRVPGLPVQVGTVPFAIAVDPGEKFAYVSNLGDNTISVLSINSSTGALKVLGAYATGTRPTSIAVLGQFVYVVNQGSSTISGFSADVSTGVLTQTAKSPFTAGSTPLFAVIDPNGKFLYAANQNSASISVQSIDPSTGDLTPSSESASTNSAPSSMSVTK